MKEGATVALIGVGLMGGSIAKGLRLFAPRMRVHAYARRRETRNTCLELGLVDGVYESPAAAVEGADLVVICTPVKRIPEMVEAIKPGLSPDAVVTDVGSTKAWLTSQISGVRFVGSHPMCGSEQTGLAAASATLYEDAVCVVSAGQPGAERVASFWTLLGARVVEMDDIQHDTLAALTSHVPHLTASALVLAVVEGRSLAELAALCGSGFRDTTRVASGDAGMWRDIVETNAAPIAAGLRKTAAQLSALADQIDAENFAVLEAGLAEAATLRKQLISKASSHRNRMDGKHVIAIDGPSASGKSTVAKGVARARDAFYVDSGALYRGMTWKVLEQGVDPQDQAAVIAVLENAEWTFRVEDGAVRFVIDAVDPGEAIRGEAVREQVSYVARIPAVREAIVAHIRGMTALGDLVVEGRDIGSVVFPDSPWKFYLDADPVERARRRNAELLQTEEGSSVDQVMESLQRRDHLDSTRKTAPLQVPEGSQRIDSTHMTLDEVINRVLELVEA